jgi:hypothetical protein
MQLLWGSEDEVKRKEENDLFFSFLFFFPKLPTFVP